MQGVVASQTGIIPQMCWKDKQDRVRCRAVINGSMFGAFHIQLPDWSTDDIIQWLTELDLPELVQKVKGTNLTGYQLLTLPYEEIFSMLETDDENVQYKLSLNIFWLKKHDVDVMELPADIVIPHEFLCPITHEIMRDPTCHSRNIMTCCVCAPDGFTYERAAINEWFLSGKFTSPMTNATLTDTTCTSNVALRTSIYQFLRKTRHVLVACIFHRCAEQDPSQCTELVVTFQQGTKSGSASTTLRFGSAVPLVLVYLGSSTGATLGAAPMVGVRGSVIAKVGRFRGIPKIQRLVIPIDLSWLLR
ncbi:hypothetical protein PR048_025897 [Dryococelus australis]|uniref:U-box domain-containing protein n=1 Tax=Dryococelus australis TaxID=614101 RepID=A0ABQ9GJV3_9NEOP|nr:hypothetical protein PR048_025897 [Dryococelus australis]